MLFRVARSREGGHVTHYSLYKVQASKWMTVLDALFQIQDKMDPSLAFRYSCRGAVCGSCAMLIDREPRLACRTQIDAVKKEKMKLKPFGALAVDPKGWDKQTEVLVEPLPNLPILKDLVVDMTRFYDVLTEMKLWTDSEERTDARIHSPKDREQIEHYVDCILCAICYGSCPVNGSRKDYVGPAALAKAWRFYQDTRIGDRARYLKAAKQENGAPLCELIMNCVRACPKGVAPGKAIRLIKAE